MLGRVLVVVVGLLGASACMRHHIWIAEGNIEVSPPGPPDVTAPAAICWWANGYNVAMPALARDPEGGHAYVACTLDQPISVPITNERYSLWGNGLLIGAYVVSIPGGVPACAGSTGLIEVEDASGFERICDGNDMPPNSEIALMAPFDDKEREGRPTATVRIAITRTKKR